MAVENTDTILPNKRRYTRFYQMISPNKGYSYYICHETRAWMYFTIWLCSGKRIQNEFKLNYVQENEFLLEFPNFSFNTFEKSGPGLYLMSI